MTQRKKKPTTEKKTLSKRVPARRVPKVKPAPEQLMLNAADDFEERHGTGQTPMPTAVEPSLAQHLQQKSTKGTAPHVIVIARAGTGKTTTLIEGLKRVRGLGSELVPSPQQAAVWKAMEEGSDSVKTICFVAFNKSIATELQQRVPEGCDAMTMHSLGFRAINKAFDRPKVNSYRVQDIISELLERDIRELRRTKPVTIKAVEELVGLCKQNLVGPGRVLSAEESNTAADNREALTELTSYYDVDCNGCETEVFDLVCRTIERCKNVQADNSIDFNDMIWLPVVLFLPIFKYDMLLVDECFPEGTVVETVDGPVPIEQIVSHGDRPWYVLSRLSGSKTLGYNRVTSAYKTPINGPLVRIKHAEGELCCTANHPLWIEGKGWTPAGLVAIGDSLSYLQKADQKGEQDLLGKVLCDIPGAKEGNRRVTPVENPDPSTQRDLPDMWEIDRTQIKDVLSQVCGDLEEAKQGPQSGAVAAGQDFQTNEGGSQGDSQPDGTCRSASKSLSYNESTGHYVHRPWGQRSDSSPPDAIVSGTSPTPTSLAMEPRVCCCQWSTETRRSNLLQNRHSITDKETSCRSGRRYTPQSDSQDSRCQKRYYTGISRVASVEVYQSTSQGRRESSSPQDCQYVYTLSVKAGSYFADRVLVKNCQDLNRCQQSLAVRAGSRLIFCGDDRQSIYGFAGADADSLPRLERELKATDRSCTVLPLTVTRRCGKAIVREAQKYVPDFEAFETNPEGKVIFSEMLIYGRCCMDGDMVLCRVNAPLVSQCFKFLKEGRKANIQGRDIGAGLLRTITSLQKKTNLTTYTVANLVRDLSDWVYRETTKEQAKRNPNDNRIINLQDRYDCLCTFCEGARTVEEVIERINNTFTDDKGTVGIRLSSVHKAKGLEASRVFILRPKGAEMPHPMAKSAWERAQEMNILYVAITRAIQELVYVS